MTHRYYSASPVTGDRAVLADQEARHLSQVMRSKLGDHVTVFDGSGAEFVGVVTDCRRNEIELEIIERRIVDREPARSIALAVALPKGDRQRTLVEKCTELGVARLTPLDTKRGVAVPTAKALERLRRSVIEASKQCGRNRLMAIDEPMTLKTLLESSPNAALADPSGVPISSIDLSSIDVFAIGPEGGFSEEELAVAHGSPHGVVSLGDRILRIETAAMAIAAKVLLG